ncbi:hypothetical protein F5Y16DRAFT_279530 [Xylariaceae sp. FL0255]|nr:hypothetical protein F5Y16DRAFT_279530 [Xylariaceae sp. FL0255]
MKAPLIVLSYVVIMRAKRDLSDAPQSPRLRQACDYCHAMKVRCSGGSPCTKCNSSNIKCHYSYTAKLGKPKGAKHKKTLARLAAAAADAATPNDFSEVRLDGEAYSSFLVEQAGSSPATTMTLSSNGYGNEEPLIFRWMGYFGEPEDQLEQQCSITILNPHFDQMYYPRRNEDATNSAGYRTSACHIIENKSTRKHDSRTGHGDINDSCSEETWWAIQTESQEFQTATPSSPNSSSPYNEHSPSSNPTSQSLNYQYFSSDISSGQFWRLLRLESPYERHWSEIERALLMFEEAHRSSVSNERSRTSV